MTVRTALLLVGALAAHQAAAAPPPPPSGPARPAIAAMLTTTAPRQELPLAAFAAAPAAVTLTIAQIENPSSQAFSLAAGIVWTDRTGHRATEPVRSVTPFPPTRPGSFAITLSAAARGLLGRSDGQLALSVAIQAIASDRPLVEPLRVAIGPPVWR